MNHAHFSIDVLTGKKIIIKLGLSGDVIDADELAALKQWAGEVQRRVKEASQSINRKVAILVDLRKLESFSEGETLAILAELMKADNPYVEKTATFGASKKIQLAEKITGMLAGRELKSFATEEMAVAWLNSNVLGR